MKKAEQSFSRLLGDKNFNLNVNVLVLWLKVKLNRSTDSVYFQNRPIGNLFFESAHDVYPLLLDSGHQVYFFSV